MASARNRVKRVSIKDATPEVQAAVERIKETLRVPEVRAAMNADWKYVQAKGVDAFLVLDPDSDVLWQRYFAEEMAP